MSKVFYECMFGFFLLAVASMGLWELFDWLVNGSAAEPHTGEPYTLSQDGPTFEDLPADEREYLRRFFK